MASTSSLADALITTLRDSSGSAFDTLNTTRNDFGLLDTTNSGCVFVVLPGGFTRIPNAFGDPQTKEQSTRLLVRCYTRETGNSVDTLNKIYRAEIDLVAALDANDTLSGSATFAFLESGNGWDGNSFVELGGQIWVPQDFTVRVQTYADLDD